MDRSGRYVACLVFGVAFAAVMSRPGAAPATLAIELASVDALQRWKGAEPNVCPAPHHRNKESNVAKSIG